MSIFDIPRTNAGKNDTPEWVVNNNEKRVYESVKQRILEIERLIEISEYPLKPSEFKIAKSSICKKLALSPSYIAKHKNFNKWVDGQQRRLSLLASDIEVSTKKRNYISKKPEQMRKDDLVIEVKKLRKALKQRNSELYIEQINKLLNSGLAESQIVSQDRIKHLEERVGQLQKINAELEVNNQRLTENLIEAIKEAKRLGSQSLRSIK